MSEEKFKPIDTQEAFDEAVKDRLSRERDKISKLETKNAELESENSTLKTNVEELNGSIQSKDEEISGLNSQLTNQNLESMRIKIAVQNGIPIEMASRLVGEDEEALRADAESLASFISSKDSPAPLKSVEPSVPEGIDGEYQEFVKGLELEGE